MLDAADNIFRIRLQVLVGGSGYFLGILDEPNQQPPPNYIFTAPRRTLRVDPLSPARAGMVVRTPMGQVLMLGDGGTSEQDGGTFKNLRAFEATHRLNWSKRNEVVDPITNMTRDDGVIDQGLIWCAYEPDAKEASGGALNVRLESGKVLTASAVQRNDLVGDYRVSRSDLLLGLHICSVG